MSNEEAIWLVEARQGNREAFGRLVMAYQAPVYNLAYRMLNNTGEAEEAAQEAFVRAYTRLASYDPTRKFSTWILSIASNYCIDVLRKRRALFLSLDDALPIHPALMSEREAGPEAQAVLNEQQQLVQQMLQALPEEYRETVILRYWYDLSYEEIAEIMQSSVSAIKSRLFRARRELAGMGVAMGLGAAHLESQTVA